MKPFQTILFGADFSEGSQRPSCGLLARRRGTDPNACPPRHRAEVGSGGAGLLGQAGVEFYDANTDGARETQLKRATARYLCAEVAIDIEYHVKEGNPATEILHMAGERRRRPDRGGDAWPDGAELAARRERRHLRHAAGRQPGAGLPCPGRPRSAEPIRAILHPTDFSERSDAAPAGRPRTGPGPRGPAHPAPRRPVRLLRQRHDRAVDLSASADGTR